MRPRNPGAYYVYDRADGSVSQMLVTRPALSEVTLAPMQAVVIEARDRFELVSYLTLPADSDSNGDGLPEEPLHGACCARRAVGSRRLWLSSLASMARQPRLRRALRGLWWFQRFR